MFMFIEVVGFFLVIAGLILAAAGIFYIRDWFRFRRLAKERAGESICQFARSFKRREVEPSVIRACWNGFQKVATVKNFPVRTSDSIAWLYGIENDELDEFFEDLAAQTGRSIKNTEVNPFHSKVESVGDFVLFLNAQPKLLLGGAPGRTLKENVGSHAKRML
jgi:hypothetical protein